MTRKAGRSAGSQRRRLVLERTFDAPLEDVWELWTTKEGIESWWGPEGFEVKVRKLQLKPGGALLYAMTATGPEQVEFMKRAGMPLTTETRITFTAVEPMRRLAYTTLADFVPGMEAYDVATEVELHPGPKGVRLVLRFDAMHDKTWTQRAVMGWKSELGKLEQALASRRSALRKITPFLWFDGNAEQAAKFYISVFKNSKILSASPMSVRFSLDGQEFIGLNGGPHYKFTPAVSFYVDCKDQAEVDALWAKLARGGKDLRCGWLTDRFGVTWQIIPSILGRLLGDPNRKKASAAQKAMMQMEKLDVAKLKAAYDRA